ncbi:MAG: hypothetical protein ACFCUV_12830, partial [Rivularia sp. (in: cyanobacteria)]
MSIRNSLNINVSGTIIQRLRQTKETVFTDNWKQTAIQSSHNAMNTVTDTVQQAKSYLQESLQPLSVQTV